MNKFFSFYTFDSIKEKFDNNMLKCIEEVLLFVVVSLAMSSIAIRGGLYLSCSFRNTASLIVTLIFIAAIFCVIRIFRLVKKLDNSEDIWCLINFLILGIIGALLAITINRQSFDDTIYIPPAIYFVEHPNEVISSSLHSISLHGDTLSTGFIFYYELTEAAFSVIFPSNFLNWYYIIFPGIIGFCFITSNILLTQIFTNSRTAVIVGVIFFILSCLLMGETHRVYGNFSLARLFQGKCVFITLGFSCWVYFSIKYFVLNDYFSLVALFSIAIGMSSITTSAIPFIPLLSVVLFIAYIVNEGNLNMLKLKLKSFIVYFLMSLPVGIPALEFISYALKNCGYGNTLNSMFPKSFLGQINLLINYDYPVTPLLFTIFFIITMILSQFRAFFLAWILMLIVFVLNPIVSPLIMKYMTSENIYWRLFFLLPFPLLIPVCVSEIWDKGKTFARVIIVLLIPVFLSLVIWGPTSVIRESNNATLSYPFYKIPLKDYNSSKKIIAGLSPGSMIAPNNISNIIILLSSKYPQLHIRNEYYLRFKLDSVGRSNDFELRHKAYEYLYTSHDSVENYDALVELLNSKDKPNYIVIDKLLPNYRIINDILSTYGYANIIKTSDYEVLSFLTSKMVSSPK